MTTLTLYTYNNLKTLEQTMPQVKKKINNNRFVFDDATNEYDFVYLGNDEENDKANYKNLDELVFESPQPKLRYLNANNCSIKKITIKNCPNLQTLFLFGNGIEEIHFEGTFPKLELVDLAKNNLTCLEMPVDNFPALKYLYLYQNKLADLSGLADFFVRKGFDFNIGKNELLTAPPKEIGEGGKSKIVEWFRQAKKYATEKAYEAKILIIGEPSAGKTTLMELLFDRNYKVPQPLQPSTLGIDVKTNREFVNPEINLPKIKAHIWDFGGQDIQYMLHQYFLTDDSVYILISDGRSGKTRYGYWFYIISLLGKKSPILVLLNRNKRSGTIIPFDEKNYREIFQELNIINCGEMDFANLNKSWDAFEEKIATTLSTIPIVGQTIIKPWKKIREKLDVLRKKNKYIALNKFEKICKECGLEEWKEIAYLLEYFHKIGIALHFNDINLQSTVFLDPNWITHPIYDVLSDTLVIDKNGEFEQEKLYEHWQSKICNSKHKQCYSPTECSFLLSLMLKDKFDICYQLPHKPGSYVVPMKLPDKRPDYNLGENKKLHFRFQYRFMPEGLLSRLIVRLHENIYEGNVWLNGALFTDNGCMAEVLQQETTGEGLKYIGIKVTGDIAENRRAFLRIIRKEVEHIHRNTFPYISFNEMVVCNCDECDRSDTPVFYSLETIKAHLKGKKRQIFCQKAATDVEIGPLLYEIYSDDEIDKEGNKKELEKLKDDSKGELSTGAKFKFIFPFIPGVFQYEIDFTYKVLIKKWKDLWKSIFKRNINNGDSK